MPPPRRRFAKQITSPRYLSLRHGRELIRTPEERDCDPEKEGELKPGEEHLHSFYVPGLTGGVHTITVNQDITVVKTGAADQKPDKSVGPKPQEFSVLAPRFELPEDAIYSVYPPPGGSATNEILPHVLFNDPTLPWERIGSVVADEENPSDYDSNRVPWLACLVFTPDELQLSDTELADIYKTTSFTGKGRQDQSLAVSTPIADLKQVGSSTATIPIRDSGEAIKTNTNLIFLRSELFDAIFSSYDDSGVPHPSPKNGPDVSRHRFLAHLREINTRGMAHADRDEEQTLREFSVVVSNRTGPLTPTTDDQPTQVIVHVVSIESVDKMRPFPITGSFSRVGLISLYSWTYMCLPPASLNVHRAFVNMSNGLRMLQPDINFSNPPKNDNPVAARMMKRLEDGYSVVRHRTQTGEETASLLRGPLIPSMPAEEDTNILSNSGSSLQILDKELGLMDITYSTAWSLGRTLALANRAYTTALTRVRRQILREASHMASSKTIRATGTLYQSKEDLLRSLADSVERMLDMTAPLPAAAASGEQKARERFKHNKSNLADLSYRAPGVSYFLVDALDEAAYKIASTSDPKRPGWSEKHDPPYNEFNTPRSPDWVLVLRFVLDLYHLDQLPSHYLLTDQSHLPSESFRIFLVDHNWVNALIDGALSLGNHGGLDNYQDDADGTPNVVDDPVRRSIKKAINRYLTTLIHGKYRPPVPRFGFYMRSAMVTAFPDLKVNCSPETNRFLGPMLLKHDIIDRDAMLGFFSGEPLAQELEEMLFTMPAHQQYFRAGSELSTEFLKTSYKRIYTVRNPKDKDQNQSIADIKWERSNGGKGTRTDKQGNPPRPPVFVWGTDSGKNDVRLLLVEKLAIDVFTTVRAEMNAKHDGWFSERCATSAMMGIQLNSPAWQLRVAKLCQSLNAASVRIHEISPCLGYKSIRLPNQPPEVKRHEDKVIASPLQRSQQESSHGLRIMQNPPHFRRVRMAPPEDDQDHDCSASDDASGSPVMTPESWSHVSSPDVAPQNNPINDEPPRMSLSCRRPKIKDNTLPTFTFAISSTSVKVLSYVPMIPQKQDIVFSIIYDRRRDNWALLGFTISIPVGPIKDKRKNLMAQIPSSGSIAVMVSNLRFNVRASYSQNEAKLKLEAKPRSRKKEVSMAKWVGRYVDDDSSKEEIDKSKRSEISVVLYGVKVNDYPAKDYPDGADVVIDYWMQYSGSRSDPVQRIAMLRKETSALWEQPVA